LDVVRLIDETEKDRTPFQISLPQAGAYRLRFGRVIGGLMASRVDMVETPASCSLLKNCLTPMLWSDWGVQRSFA